MYELHLNPDHPLPWALQVLDLTRDPEGSRGTKLAMEPDTVLLGQFETLPELLDEARDLDWRSGGDGETLPGYLLDRLAEIIPRSLG